jgi:hypothetical protein
VVRDFLLREVYKLVEATEDPLFEDLRNWSNADLLEYYGNLRVQEYIDSVKEDPSK